MDTETHLYHIREMSMIVMTVGNPELRNQLLGRPMTRAGAAHIYKRAKDKAQIRKTGGIHTLRHAYATRLLKAGVELPVIRRRFGHSSIRSTMRYLHLAHDKTSATPSSLDLLEFPLRCGTRADKCGPCVPCRRAARTEYREPDPPR